MWKREQNNFILQFGVYGTEQVAGRSIRSYLELKRSQGLIATLCEHPSPKGTSEGGFPSGCQVALLVSIWTCECQGRNNWLPLKASE